MRELPVSRTTATSKGAVTRQRQASIGLALATILVISTGESRWARDPPSDWLRYRDHISTHARYRQADPVGLAAGTNRMAYADGNALARMDPDGLWWAGLHNSWGYTQAVAAGFPHAWAARLGKRISDVDRKAGSQEPEQSHWHAMRDPNWSEAEAKARFDQHVESELAKCTMEGLAFALHAIQDSHAPAHRDFKPWGGMPPLASYMADLLGDWGSVVIHVVRDAPTPWNIPEILRTKHATFDTIQRWKAQCQCAR